MINSGLGVVQIAVTTLCTIAYVGLGFLPRPNRAAATWSIALALSMVSSYGWAAANVMGNDGLRAASVGLVLGATLLVWSGARAYRGLERTGLGVALAGTAGSAIVLWITQILGFYPMAFRVVFAATAVVSALTILELLRLTGREKDEALPLVFVSAGYIVVSVIGLVDGAIQFFGSGAAAAGSNLQLMRELNSMSSIIYTFGALLTFLLLTRRTPPAGPARAQSVFEAVATDRLARAEEAGDQWWGVLDIRLDDPVDIREVASTSAYDQIAERFARDVRTTLPADADIDAHGTSRFTALLPRPDAATRQLLSQLLSRVSTAGPDAPLAVRLSASIGWASVAIVGYRLEDLLAAADEAATHAQRSGGDRWERTTVPLDA